MKLAVRIAVVLVLSVLVIPAFANDTHNIGIQLENKTILAGTNVPAGNYTMVIDRDGQQVKFTLKQGKKVVVETKASFVEGKPMADDIVVVKSSDKVKSIDIPKLKGAIVFSE